MCKKISTIFNANVHQRKSPQDTFILVGGRNSNLETVDTLYMYQPADDSWIELDAKLESGKKDVIAMVVKQSNFPQCT